MFFRVLLLLSVVCSLVACGGGGGGDAIGLLPGAESTGTASFGVSDAPVQDLSSVVIEVDRITLKRVGGADIVIDTFDSSDLGITGADTFQIDLLNYQGVNQAIVIDQLVLPAGKYADLRLKILDQNMAYSYVDRISDGQRRPIKVPSGELKLGGFDVTADAVQTFTIEFDLRWSMAHAVGPDQYNLKPRGVRIVKNEAAATLSGSVDPSLFMAGPSCTSVDPSTGGNIVYLYEGHNLTVADLVDNYDPLLAKNAVPANAIAPYSSVAPSDSSGSWRYEFGFLPAGDYTLVFSCDPVDDLPEEYDSIALPLPASQLLEIALPVGTDVTCNLPIVAGSCGG